MKTHKIVRGYTAQARFYATHLETTTGDWDQIGWMKDRGGSKPVYRMRNGFPVAIFDGRDHLTVIVRYVDASDILATEDECFALTDAARHADSCPECERSNGPHYRGPCTH